MSFLAFLNRFQNVEKMTKIEQKVKAYPLPFRSILAMFSTFLKLFINGV